MSSSSLALFLSLLCTLASVQAQLRVFDLHATDLSVNLLGTVDAYVKVSCDEESLGKTTVRRNTEDPWWGEEFTHEEAGWDSELRLDVFDQDIGLDDHLGTCKRNIEKGTYTHECFLKKGGTLVYSYTLE